MTHLQLVIENIIGASRFAKNLLDTMKMDKGITENLLKRFGTVQQMTVTVAVSITAITIAQDITPSTSIAFSKKELLSLGFLIALSMPERLKHMHSFA